MGEGWGFGNDGFISGWFMGERKILGVKEKIENS